jgi:hypothetical protein
MYRIRPDNISNLYFHMVHIPLEAPEDRTTQAEVLLAAFPWPGLRILVWDCDVGVQFYTSVVLRLECGKDYLHAITENSRYEFALLLDPESESPVS